MIKTYRLDKSFGPVGSFAGILIFMVGLVTTTITLMGLLLVIIGAMVGFTSTSAQVDYDKRRVRFSENLFGVFRMGKWIDIQPQMFVGIKKSSNVWRNYSRSNRSIDTISNDFRLILYDAHQREIMPIMKMNSMDSAQEELEKFNSKMGLVVLR